MSTRLQDLEDGYWKIIKEADETERWTDRIALAAKAAVDGIALIQLVEVQQAAIKVTARPGVAGGVADRAVTKAVEAYEYFEKASIEDVIVPGALD
jgi:hypothetical protein